MNKTLFLLIPFFFILPKIFASQTWLDLNFSKQLSKSQDLELNQNIEFNNGFKEFYWYQVQGMFVQKLPLNLATFSIGSTFIYRISDKSPSWIFEFQPCIFADQEISIPFFKFFFQEGLLLRVPQKEKVRFVPTFYGGLVLMDCGWCSLSVANEIDFNYFGRGIIDIIYVYANLELKLFNMVFLDTYYAFYIYKQFENSKWISQNVLGLSLGFRF